MRHVRHVRHLRQGDVLRVLYKGCPECRLTSIDLGYISAIAPIPVHVEPHSAHPI